MAEITIRAETNTLGLRAGDVQTVEDTPFIRKVVEGGRLTVVDSTCADSAASPPAPDHAGALDATTPGATAQKSRRRRAAGDAQGDGELADVVEARPAAEADAVLGEALVTVRSPELPPAA